MSACRVVLLGAGGHAAVVVDAIRAAGGVLPEVALDGPLGGRSVGGVPVAGGDELLPSLASRGITHFVLGIGGQGVSPLRARLWESAVAAGLLPLGIVHPSAVVSPGASLGEGVQVMAGAVVQTGAVIGRGVIVNSMSLVEHDCEVGEFSHIAPRACLGGGVRTGSHCHIGLGAVVREFRTLGPRVLVGAGAVVVRDFPSPSRLLGVPARPTPDHL